MRSLAYSLPRLKGGWLILLAALSSAGCAKIGDPHPPQVRIPLPATDLAVHQLSDAIVLTVSKPERNTNGSEVTTLKSVEVLRLTGSNDVDGAGALSQEQFIKQAVRIFSVPVSRFPEFQNGRAFVFEDKFETGKQAVFSTTFWYAVLFVNNRNQSAGLSNRVSIRPVPIPSHPDGLIVEGTQNYIQLKWTAPAQNMDGSRPPRIAGYNIYKTEEAGKFPSTPVNLKPVQVSEFHDPDFHFGSTYYYCVATVASTQQPYAESLPSDSVAITTKDVFPPAAPGEFNAVLLGNEVLLLWTPSPSTDVAGYRIFRREKGSADRQVITEDLIRSLSFRDALPVPGKKYEYEILAVDAYGNASPAVKIEPEQR